jgi:transposase
MVLTDDQWNVVKDLLPSQTLSGAGRPPLSTRRVLDGILWKLRTTASWEHLPLDYSSPSTCCRYYKLWLRLGLFDQVIASLILHLQESGFNLQDLLQSREFESFHIRKRAFVTFAPRWQDTWQSSTALLYLQLLLMKKRKLGNSRERFDLSYLLALRLSTRRMIG